MKKFMVILFACSLLAYTVLASADTGVENPKICKQCGMDRTVYAKSRMLIVYSDGTEVGVCSLHCAIADIKQNKDKQVASLKVADYDTLVLIDAKTATWVVGGAKKGVMTALAKWAFAEKGNAQKFIRENGGRITTFDEAQKSAAEEIDGDTGTTHKHHKHSGHDMGPGAQMLFNPGFGNDIYHTHPAGMWMVDYKFMRMNMNGLRSGTSNVSQSNVGYMKNLPYNYMMVPTSMTMDMHMLMLMYGVTDRMTVMAMSNYQDNKMGMLMDMGPGRAITDESPMHTSGYGDTDLRGIYKINKYFFGSLGLSVPTGDINKTIMMMRRTYRAPYDMQLGSGTYDLKPALTYTDLSDDSKWNWGAQTEYTYHIGKNDNDYSLGNSIKVSGWLQRALGPVTSWMRLAYSNTARIRGQDSAIDLMIHPLTGMGAPMPDADPANYGGQRLDGLLGISYTKGPFSIGIEGGIPAYQRLNGLQLKTTWVLNGGIQVMF